MSSDSRDYKLDIASLKDKQPASSTSLVGRPFLSVHFACCGVYQRIYRDAAGTAYHGKCPRCGNVAHFPVGQSGTSARFFRVS
jgi:hypothetical protein